MTPPFDLAALDLNALFRNALHRRGAGGGVEGPLREALAQTVPPEHVEPLHAGFSRTITRVSSELGGSEGDALHTIVVNLARFHFNVRWDGAVPGDEVTDDSYVTSGGALRRLGDLPSDTRASITRSLQALPGATSVPAASPPPTSATSGGGCIVMLGVVAGAMAYLLR
ncbi:MAG: hypothetical protein U0166_13760 [Acidobacteriota bacterium]